MEHFGCLVSACMHQNYRTQCLFVTVNAQEPQEVALGDPFYENQFSGAKRRKVLHQNSHISLLDTLTNLLRAEEILTEVLNPHLRITLHDY